MAHDQKVVGLNFVASFNVVFFLRITTLLTWLKSTLLLKNKCFDTTIYMKTQCFQTNETQHYWKGKSLRSERWSRERVALIKSLIYTRWLETSLRCGCQIKLNLSADMSILGGSGIKTMQVWFWTSLVLPRCLLTNLVLGGKKN